MLKRSLFSALAALILLFTLCALNSMSLSRAADELFEAAKSCYHQAQTGEKTEEEILAAIWSKKLGYLESTLSHVDAQNIAQAIAEFTAAVKAQDETELLRAYAVLCERLAYLKEIDRLSLRNIL